jgi:hypothetical protein
MVVQQSPCMHITWMSCGDVCPQVQQLLSEHHLLLSVDNTIIATVLFLFPSPQDVVQS